MNHLLFRKFWMPGGQDRPAACFDPISIAMIGLSVVSTAISAIGAVSQGNAAQAAAEANARNLEETASIEERQGRTAADRERRKGMIARGQTIAALAASGVDVQQGTPLELLGEQAKETEFQALQAKFERDDRAWSLRQQALQARQQGAAAQAAATSSAIGTAIGGAARAGMQADSLLKPRATTDAYKSPYGNPLAPRPD
jgi:hypothetical protein